MAAEGLIAFDELRTKLPALDEIRATAERELQILKSDQEHLESLERDKEALLETYAALAPEALNSLDPEVRYRLYKISVESCTSHRWNLRYKRCLHGRL